jgi:hypothetical protein
MCPRAITQVDDLNSDLQSRMQDGTRKNADIKIRKTTRDVKLGLSFAL